MSNKYPHKLATLGITMALVLAGVAALLWLLGGLPQPAFAQEPVGTAFTYQGRLILNGTPVTDTCDFQFGLWDASSGGNQKGVTQAVSSVSVKDGYFTTRLNESNQFGNDAFTGDTRWLAISVRCPAGGDSYTSLSERVELTAAPYALYATSTGALHGRSVTTTAPNNSQVLKWNGSAWAPAADSDTTYTAGTGLTLNGTTFSVDTATIQRRVNGVCAVGNTIRVINADGTVICEAHDTCPVFSLTAHDSAGNVNGGSVAIGVDGLGLIAYDDISNDDLKVAHCNDIACTSATLTMLDAETGNDASITIGSDGLGLISYCKDNPPSALKVAHCNDVACTSATITTLESGSGWGIGYDTSVTIGSDGLGLISYRDEPNTNLKVAHCSNVNCTSATITTLDSAGDVGHSTSITIGSDGLGLISYEDSGNGDLKVAHCSNVNCTSATITTLDSAGNVGYNGTSVTIGSDGLGLVSYYDNTNGDLKVAHCSDVNCTIATICVVDSAGDVGPRSSVAITDGLGLISYTDLTNGDLKVAHFSDVFYVPYFQCIYLPLVMKGYCSCGPDNYEPNDSCDQAYGCLTSGQTYQSWISYCDLTTYKKSDYFYIDIGTTNTINIYLTNIPAGTDYDLCLYRNPSDDPNNPAACSRNYGNSPERITYNPPAIGRYYIRVYSYKGSSTSPYSLQVTY